MGRPSILLTNDDGIDAPGLGALHAELSAVGDVTVVAPADNQSGVGRTRNGRVTVADHQRGHELSGTPADCVAFGLGGGLEREFEFVVAGVNDGPNIGNYVVGRSGTVGACIEAALLDVPAIAVSAYHTEDFHCYPPEAYDFGQPATIARRLLAELAAVDDPTDVGVLNVNAPVDRDSPPIRLTRLVTDYSQRVEFEAERDHPSNDHREAVPNSDASLERAQGRPVELIDKTWPHVDGYENPLKDGARFQDRYPSSSDRRALIDGAVSISPLSLSQTHRDSPTLTSLVDRLNGA